MEKTAIEWLVSQLNKQGFAQVVTDEEIKQAKEMEKKQIIDFADNYGFDICGYDYQRAEQYYNKTFKQDKHEQIKIQ